MLLIVFTLFPWKQTTKKRLSILVKSVKVSNLFLRHQPNKTLK